MDKQVLKQVLLDNAQLVEKIEVTFPKISRQFFK